jgi:hypothetical protein
LDVDDLDPYSLLDIPYNATDEEIQEAFRMKMATAQDTELLIRAYGMIRHQSGRNQIRWDKGWSFLTNPFQVHEKKSIDIAALAKELAFLSSWELGDDHV